MEDIREQIEFLKISGSVLPVGSAEKIAGTMENLLSVALVADRLLDNQSSRNLVDLNRAMNTLKVFSSIQTKGRSD